VDFSHATQSRRCERDHCHDDQRHHSPKTTKDGAEEACGDARCVAPIFVSTIPMKIWLTDETRPRSSSASRLQQRPRMSTLDLSSHSAERQGANERPEDFGNAKAIMQSPKIRDGGK